MLLWDKIIRNWLWCFFETKEHKNDSGKSHVILSEVSKRGRAQQGIFSSRKRHGCSCVRSESQIFSLRPHQIQSPSIYPMTSKSLKFRNDAWTWIGCDYIVSRPLTGKLEHDETLSLMSSSQQWKFVIHGLTRLIFPFLSYSTPRILVPEKCLNDKYELRVRSRTAYSRWAYINPPPHSPLPPFPPSPLPLPWTEP